MPGPNNVNLNRVRLALCRLQEDLMSGFRIEGTRALGAHSTRRALSLKDTVTVPALRVGAPRRRRATA